MDDRPETGSAETIFPGIVRIVAPNPSPMTYWGTNSYIIGDDECAVVDPGPEDQTHMSALLSAIAGRRVTAVLVTHAHLDHSSLVARFAQHVNAPVYGFGPSEAGRSETMKALAMGGEIGGGEGVHKDFSPDHCLEDGDTIDVRGFSIQAIHTPGHFPGHLSFGIGDILLSGDHLMGWSTTLISPPDGDVAAFFSSCARLLEMDHHAFLPGHGGPVTHPRSEIEAQVKHRRTREQQILDTLSLHQGSPEELARQIYTELDPRLLPAATRNVLAHLVDLHTRGLVQAEPKLSVTAQFSLC